MRILRYLALYAVTLFLIVNINAIFNNHKGATLLTSLSWIANHNHQDFPADLEWKLPSTEQQRADGLNFMSVSQAIDDGKLNSQAAYTELVRVNKISSFHKENIRQKINTPTVKVWGILLFILFIYIYYKNRKNIKSTEKKWK